MSSEQKVRSSYSRFTNEVYGSVQENLIDILIEKLRTIDFNGCAAVQKQFFVLFYMLTE